MLAISESTEITSLYEIITSLNYTKKLIILISLAVTTFLNVLNKPNNSLSIVVSTTEEHFCLNLTRHL